MLPFVTLFFNHNFIGIFFILFLLLWESYDNKAVMRISISFVATNYPEKQKQTPNYQKIAVTVMLLIFQGRGIRMEINLTWVFCVSYWHIKYNLVFIGFSWYMFLMDTFEDLRLPFRKFFLYPVRIKIKPMLWSSGLSLIIILGFLFTWNILFFTNHSLTPDNHDMWI